MKKVLSNVSNKQKQNVSDLDFTSKIIKVSKAKIIKALKGFDIDIIKYELSKEIPDTFYWDHNDVYNFLNDHSLCYIWNFLKPFFKLILIAEIDENYCLFILKQGVR